MIRVIIVDDHAVVRQGLGQILREAGDFEICGEAGNAGELFELPSVAQCDVLVLDLSMPGRGGLDILKQVRADLPHVRVLILSMHAEQQYAVRAVRAGAHGYLRKDAATEELVAALRQIAAGRRYITPEVAEQLSEALTTGEDRPPHERLSDREYHVLRRIAAGKTVGDIAEELSLSVKTISTYRARILEKMNMETNAALTHYMIANHLLD